MILTLVHPWRKFKRRSSFFQVWVSTPNSFGKQTFLLKLSEKSSPRLGTEKMFFSLSKSLVPPLLVAIPNSTREKLKSWWDVGSFYGKMKKYRETLPQAKFILVCFKMLRRIKSKHHLVVLNCVVLPISLHLRPYWFLSKIIVLWSDCPALNMVILYTMVAYAAMPYPERLHYTRASDSILGASAEAGWAC